MKNYVRNALMNRLLNFCRQEHRSENPFKREFVCHVLHRILNREVLTCPEIALNIFTESFRGRDKCVHCFRYLKMDYISLLQEDVKLGPYVVYLIIKLGIFFDIPISEINDWGALEL